MQLSNDYSLSVKDHSVETLYELVDRGLKDSPYKDPINEEYIKKNILKFTELPNAIIIFLNFQNIPVGYLAAHVIHTHLWEQPIASELMFWIDKDHRGKHAGELIEAYEYWAKIMGCTKATLSHYSTTNLSKWYERLGYQKLEETYIRNLV